MGRLISASGITTSSYRGVKPYSKEALKWGGSGDIATIARNLDIPRVYDTDKIQKEFLLKKNEKPIDLDWGFISSYHPPKK